MFYRNTQNLIKALAEKLEIFLDSKEDLAKFDVLAICGHQSKEEKSAFLKHFSTCNGEKLNFKITHATNEIPNTKIDCEDFRFMFQLDLPTSVWDFAQELGPAGRASHITSNDYTYFLFFSLQDVIYLFKRMNNTSE